MPQKMKEHQVRVVKVWEMGYYYKGEQGTEQVNHNRLQVKEGEERIGSQNKDSEG